MTCSSCCSPGLKSSRSANRKMNPNEAFSGKLLSNYTAMLWYTLRLDSSLLSPASVLLCQGEGGIHVGPFMKPATPFGVDLARRILCLSGGGELTGKRQRRDGVASLGTEPASRPPTAGLTRSQSEGLTLLSDILMSGRPDQIISLCWGLCFRRRGGC